VTTRPDEAQVDAWIALSLQGDQEAFGRLVEAKQALVLRAAWNRLGDREAARSVAQAVFVRLWQNLDRFDRSRRFDTWLYRLTVNAAIDHHRRAAARPGQTGFDELFEATAATVAGGETEAERDFETAEIGRVLHELTALLTDKQRQAFLLREVEGLPTGEVAEILETSESTIRNHVFQARKLLRRELLQRYPEYARSFASNGDDDDGEER
jgi:RNA polymerase sigma-70 factor (ECF subfamily)